MSEQDHIPSYDSEAGPSQSEAGLSPAENLPPAETPSPGEAGLSEVKSEAGLSQGETSISQYLSDISPLLTEGDIRTVLRKRGISPDTPLEELTERERDLAEAEAYYKLCDQPVGGQTVKDVDGSWSHTEGGWTVSKANIDLWYRKYKTLRELWGEPVISRSKIRIINL